MFRSLHFPALKVIFLAGAAVAAHVARQDPSATASSPLLVLQSLEQVTACQPVNIGWIYSGPNEPITLIVTNGGVDQVAPPPSPSSTDANTLTDNNDNTIARRAAPTGTSVILNPIAILLPQDLSYNWTQVNVPQGWYRLVVIMPTLNYSTHGSDFYVSAQGDTTCLLTTSSSSSPPSSSPTPTPTGSSPPPTSPSPSPSQSPSQTPTPVFAASSSVNKGAIAGGVVAGVVLIAVFLIVYLCRSKRRTHQAHPPRSRGLHSIGGWGGLASVDSHLDPASRNTKPKPQPKPYASIRHQSQTESLGPIIPGAGAASEENIQAYRAGGTFSPSEEKFAVGEVGALPYSQSPRSGVLGRTHSASSFASTNEFAMGRRPSISATTALPPGARRRSVEYPPPAASQMDRAPSGASSHQQAQRKTPRKPVPAYAPGSSPSSSIPSPIATASPTTPLSASPFDDDQVQRRVSGGSTRYYATRARDRDGSRDRGGKDGMEQSRTRDVEDDPVLSHKSSFGPGGVEGKPLHYLIPDMPPPPVA